MGKIRILRVLEKTVREQLIGKHHWLASIRLARFTFTKHELGIKGNDRPFKMLG